MYKKHRFTAFALAISALTLVGCGDNSSTSGPITDGEFDYEDPNAGILPPDISVPGDSTSTGPIDNFGDLDIAKLATIDKEGTFVVEAEDCDTKGCTLQAGCAGFYESTDLASGGQCIACIASPSILAFSFELTEDFNISLQTVSAKYENPWNLDSNVQYYIDGDMEEEIFTHMLSSNGYTEFGPNADTQWYNWKTVDLGNVDLKKGTHTMYIRVVGAFPNTDCFNIIASAVTEA